MTRTVDSDRSVQASLAMELGKLNGSHPALQNDDILREVFRVCHFRLEDDPTNVSDGPDLKDLARSATSGFRWILCVTLASAYPEATGNLSLGQRKYKMRVQTCLKTFGTGGLALFFLQLVGGVVLSVEREVHVQIKADECHRAAPIGEKIVVKAIASEILPVDTDEDTGEARGGISTDESYSTTSRSTRRDPASQSVRKAAEAEIAWPASTAVQRNSRHQATSDNLSNATLPRYGSSKRSANDVNETKEKASQFRRKLVSLAPKRQGTRPEGHVEARARTVHASQAPPVLGKK
ncbi:hypothetical protein BKA93DRAFT_751117 [Sparassis latifolia]